MDYGVASGGTLRYRKEIEGYDRKRHSLTLTANKSNWSSCSGKDTLTVDTFFEANYKRHPEGSGGQDALKAKKDGRINHGDLYLENGKSYIRFKWRKCD